MSMLIGDKIINMFQFVAENFLFSFLFYWYKLFLFHNNFTSFTNVAQRVSDFRVVAYTNPFKNQTQCDAYGGFSTDGYGFNQELSNIRCAIQQTCMFNNSCIFCLLVCLFLNHKYVTYSVRNMPLACAWSITTKNLAIWWWEKHHQKHRITEVTFWLMENETS